jgi:hypothetical protein
MNPLAPEGTIAPHQPPRWLILCAAAAFASLYLFLYRHDLLYQWLEDLHVYAGAVQLFRSGVNPYYQSIFEGLRFVYPPVVLYAFRALAAVLPGNAFWLVLAFVHLTSVLLAPFVLARHYLREHWLTPSMALLVWLGESRFTGMQALYSANVAPTLYLAALLAAVPGLRKNRWGWFYAAVLLGGMVKITFLVMLLFPLLAGRRQWWRSVGCGVGVAAAYALQARLFPALYAGYKWAVLQQVQVEHQFGYGVFGVAASLDEKLHRPVGLDAYGVHALFAAVLLGALLWLRRRGADVRDPNVWMGMLVMAVIVVNPRVLHYDAYLALFAAYVVLAVTLRLEGWKLIALLAAMYAPSLAVPHVIHAKLMYGSYELCLILIALAAGIWRLWGKTGQGLEAAGDRMLLQSMGVQSSG